mgnify:CR=1 FL=1
MKQILWDYSRCAAIQDHLITQIAQNAQIFTAISQAQMVAALCAVIL